MSKFEKWALLIASDVRIALVNILGSDPREYAEMKENIENILGREVSAGSLDWHIEKLKGIGVIEKKDVSWHLTESGRKLHEKISSVSPDAEASSPPSGGRIS